MSGLVDLLLQHPGGAGDGDGHHLAAQGLAGSLTNGAEGLPRQADQDRLADGEGLDLRWNSLHTDDADLLDFCLWMAEISPGWGVWRC